MDFHDLIKIDNSLIMIVLGISIYVDISSHANIFNLK